MGIFKAYDVRGIYGSELNENIAYRIGYFLPGLVGAKEIVVGHDTRLSSPSLFEAFTKGVCDSGNDVVSLGLATTPFVYYATVKLHADCSVQITASHNSKEYNGFKISKKDAIPMGGETGLKDLEKLVMSDKETPVAENRGTIKNKKLYSQYKAFLKRYMSDYTNLKISFDLSSGMANLFAKDVFGKDKFKYINDSLDGSFPSHEPNPLIPGNCVQLAESVMANSSDVGVIYDGDADRVVFVDDRGRFIQPDYITSLIGFYYKHFLGEEGRNVVVDIRTSKSTTDYLKKEGFNPIIWKVGHSFAKLKIRETDAIFGGELAGHYYFKDFFWCDSGMFASILVLNTVAYLKSEGKKLSEFVDEIVAYVNSGEVNFKLENKDAAIEALKDEYLPDAGTVYDFDGYRIEYSSWWFSIRKSNTEPYLRLIVEAKDKAKFDENFGKIKSIIEKFK